MISTMVRVGRHDTGPGLAGLAAGGKAPGRVAASKRLEPEARQRWELVTMSRFQGRSFRLRCTV